MVSSVVEGFSITIFGLKYGFLVFLFLASKFDRQYISAAALIFATRMTQTCTQDIHIRLVGV